MGSGFTLIAALVGAQASAPHIHLAMVTALIRLAGQVGEIIGAGICAYFPVLELLVLVLIPSGSRPHSRRHLDTHVT